MLTITKAPMGDISTQLWVFVEIFTYVVCSLIPDWTACICILDIRYISILDISIILEVYNL